MPARRCRHHLIHLIHLMQTARRGPAVEVGPLLLRDRPEPVPAAVWA